MLESLKTIAYICAIIVIAPALLMLLIDLSYLAIWSAYNTFKKLESKYRYSTHTTKTFMGSTGLTSTNVN